jgi:hypothetical protein
MTWVNFVPAIHVADFATFRAQRIAGSFHVVGPDEGGEQTFWYCCPSGSGDIGPLLVGNGFKPAIGPSWQWNGSLSAPTLYPSVNHVGRWHGWLRDGRWTEA